MKLINKISLSELELMSEKMYGLLVKAVVDVKNKSVVVDAEMHVDIEQFLLEKGSAQEDLWGINLYPSRFKTDGFIEFDSMINIRPRQNNRSRTVEDEKIKQQIRDIVAGVVYEFADQLIREIAIKAKRNGENDLMIGAIDRTLDLFNATTETLIANKSPRAKEVLRAEDQFLSLFFDDNFADADRVDEYFMQYALAARNGRG